jgi:hypothetical protein
VALGVPLLVGCGAALFLLPFPGWIGPKAQTWQFVLGIGMACAVTALPILILLMEKLEASCARTSASASCVTRASTTSPSGACWRSS